MPNSAIFVRRTKDSTKPGNGAKRFEFRLYSMALLDVAVAVIARSPKGDVAIQGSPSALRSLDRRVASLLAMTGPSERATL